MSTKDVQAQLAIGGWPKSGYDTRHSGQSPYNGPQQKHLKWIFDSGGQIVGSPVVANDGTVYFGNGSNGPDDPGAFYALNPNGTVKWTYDGEREFNSSPAIDTNGVIYAAARDSKLYAFNPDGTIRWTHSTVTNGSAGDLASSINIASDGTIYVGSANGYLYAINPDGTLKWNASVGFVQYASPTIAADGTIYVVSLSGLYAINPDGSIKWSNNSVNYGTTPAIGSDGTLYINNAGVLRAFNPDGTVRWEVPHSGNSNAQPGAAIGSDGTIYVGTHEQLGKLLAVRPDGTIKWTYATGAIAHGAPIVDTTGTIYVGSQNSNDVSLSNATYAISADGNLLWTHSDDGVVSSPAMDAAGTLYTGGSSGRVTAFSVNPVTDSQPPQVRIFSPKGVVNAQTADINASVVDISETQLTYKLDGTTISGANNTIDLTYVAVGAHTFQITATDGSGNSTTASSDFTYEPDINTLSTVIAQMQADQEITYISDAFTRNLDRAKTYIEAGQYTRARIALQSLRTQVRTQLGISTTTSAKSALLNQIQYVQQSLPR